MDKHWVQEWADFYSAVIPCRCPLSGAPRCLRNSCPYYRPRDFAHILKERCTHPAAVLAAGVDPRQREPDFHVAANTLNWLRAEQLALAGLQDRNLTKAQRDIWAKRLAVVSRRISLG